MEIISSILAGSAQALCQSMNMTERRGGHKTDLKEAITDLETATSELKAIRNDVDWLPSLEVLTLRSLHKLSRVWRNPVNQECLRNIRCIHISQCHKLKNVSWVQQLPKLQTIVLLDCRELEELISDHESPSIEHPVLFPGLKNLSTKDLPELRSILPSRFSFQQLETLVVINCPKVKKLPFQERVQPNLPAVYCDEKWWDALEKDQPNEELCCLPRFVPN